MSAAAILPVDVAPPVLVVDDDPGLRRLLAFRLHLLGREAVSAGSVDEAIVLLETHDVSAVVSDYAMPGATGLDLLAYCHRRRPELPFVLTSGLFPAGVEAAAKSEGATAVVAKDALPAALSQLFLSTIPRSSHGRAVS